MKKNIFTFLFSLIIILILFTSCKKYLDKRPNNAITTPSTINDLQALLDNVNIMNQRVTPSFAFASDDDYFLLANSYSSFPLTSFKNSYTWTPFDYAFSNDWSKGYIPIYYANLCLEIIETIPKTDANKREWNNVKGSALFFRAYYFSQLAFTFAKAYDESSYTSDLGISLRLSSNFNVKSTRANVKETYLQILADATQAIEYLPSKSLHPLRPSQVATYGLLARVYLAMRKYDLAFSSANEYLHVKDSLMDYKSISNSSVPFQKYNPETIFYTDANTTVAPFATSKALIDSLLYSNYSTADKRKTLFFAPAGVYQKFKGFYSGSASFFFSGIATDEIYLIRAECNARSGNADAALNDLNRLLTNRYDNSFVPIVGLNSINALTRILVERRKELLYRGLRWIDIKRLNKEDNNIILKRIIGTQTYTLMPNANYYAVPLPKDIIDETGMPQNPI